MDICGAMTLPRQTETLGSWDCWKMLCLDEDRMTSHFQLRSHWQLMGSDGKFSAGQGCLNSTLDPADGSTPILTQAAVTNRFRKEGKRKRKERRRGKIKEQQYST